MIPASDQERSLVSSSADSNDPTRDYLNKMRHYDAPHATDIVLDASGMMLLQSIVARLDRLQKNIGHGHFYLLSFDEALKHAQKSSIGSFTREEKEFLDAIFHTDASRYGFLDSKPLTSLTASIPRAHIVKVAGMGNYLYRGDALETWNSITRTMGSEVILTSGIRGIIKQMHLFLLKALNNGGNLSLASRSLAPPGYSYHAVGDFDVGQRGFGIHNFTSSFTESDVFHKLSDLGFISMRYPQDNFLGVRFEPWHVKVAHS